LAEQRYKILFIQYVKEHLILTFYTTSKVLGHGRSSKENNSIKKSEDCLPVFALFISFAHHHTSKQNSE
ncbi:hypothetical protein, partial [Bacteroides thetaiotaomicron]|uniref:hypothetical protein n=1 Tax=Bacteroides thetaiotaomicron TaxID=818 RepID=UPI003562B08F